SLVSMVGGRHSWTRSTAKIRRIAVSARVAIVRGKHALRPPRCMRLAGYLDRVVPPVPLVVVEPEERKRDGRAFAARNRKVDVPRVEPRCSADRILDILPAIARPVHAKRPRHLNAENLSRCHARNLPVE